MKTRSQQLAEKRYGLKLAKHNSIGYARRLKNKCVARRGHVMVMYFAIFFPALAVAIVAPRVIAGIMFLIASLASFAVYQITVFYRAAEEFLDTKIAEFPEAKSKKVRK